MAIEQQLQQLATIVAASNEKSMTEITRSLNVVMLSSGTSTIERMIRFPRVDGVSGRGLHAMLQRIMKASNYRTIMISSDVIVVMDHHDILGYFTLSRSIRSYELTTTCTREVQLVLLRNKQIRSMIRQDRRPTMQRAYVVLPAQTINTRVLAMGKVDHPTWWDVAYPYLVDHTGTRSNMCADPVTFWERWKNSNANLVLLLGEPGTGKSSWMRGLMDARGYRGTTPIVIDSADVLECTNINAFLSGVPDGGMVIIEDADQFLGKRENGNSKMAGLLNAVAGIANLRFKIVISTNLPTLRNVDTAVYRPGRGYEVLEFRKMTREQAINARAMYVDKPPVDLPEGEYTLAEVLNYGNVSAKSFEMGFVKKDFKVESVGVN